MFYFDCFPDGIPRVLGFCSMLTHRWKDFFLSLFLCKDLSKTQNSAIASAIICFVVRLTIYCRKHFNDIFLWCSYRFDAISATKNTEFRRGRARSGRLQGERCCHIMVAAAPKKWRHWERSKKSFSATSSRASISPYFCRPPTEKWQKVFFTRRPHLKVDNCYPYQLAWCFWSSYHFNTMLTRKNTKFARGKHMQLYKD